MIEQNLILILVALPFFAALINATLNVSAHRAAAWSSGLSLGAGLLILLALMPPLTEQGILRSVVQWVPSVRLNLSFRLDWFSWSFTFLVLFIGILVVVYARFYLDKTDPVPRFYSFLMAFTGAMVGVLTSGNILMLVVFWELTSLTSFLLIGYWYQNQSARDGARMALVVTGSGGLCLLVGMLVIGQIVGSYDLDRVLGSGALITSHPLYPVALVLFLLGAFTKSAQFPFHFWLPGAMAAPTPVSSFLHSATMVKAGVFLLIRFQPALGGTDLWFWLVCGTGMATLTIGAVIGLFRHDLKGLLAYSTISHLGLITALAGMGSPLAIAAAVFHIANHAIFKASLFMMAGIVDHETGTRDMRRLSGLRRLMPVTAVLAILGSAAMAGVPLLSGFLSKEMFLAETLAGYDGSLFDQALPVIATVASLFSAAYSLRLVHAVFFGPEATDLPKTPHEPPHWMRLPVELLVCLSVLIGVLPALTIEPWVNLAAGSIIGPAFEGVHIAIWHGFNTALLMSVIALGGGAALYLLTAKAIEAGPEGPPLLHRLRAQKIYERILLEGTWKIPRLVYQSIGTERLQPQIRMLMLMAVIAGLYSLWGVLQFSPVPRMHDMNPAFALMWVVGAACAAGAAVQAKYHRFAAVILLGGAGLVTCVTFAWLSAPDLAVTQLLVEIVTTVLLLLGLRWLPKRNEEIPEDKEVQAKARRLRDFIIAAFAGLGLALISYALMTRPLIPNIGDWFLRNAYYEGGGTNTVNVILVDFRAFDTFGEITVLAIVGLTVYALLRRFRPAPESAVLPAQQGPFVAEALKDYLTIPALIMRWMFPVLMLVAAYFFFRGHDLPGGGFSAGVTMAIAFLLQYIAHNVRWVESRLVVLPIRWMGFGLLIAGAAGVGAWLFGYPFLTAHARYIDVPLIGKVPAASAMIFDTGVFALVMGATVLMLIAIAHQSLRSARRREQTGEAEKDTNARKETV